MDWKDVLYKIYTPEVGSLWSAPNCIWNNSFASNKPKDDFHPALVGRVLSSSSITKIVPGTTKNYRKGSCVYRVTLKSDVNGFPESYFLIDLWMSYSIEDIIKLKRGWNGVSELNDEQLKAFKLQIKICNSIDV